MSSAVVVAERRRVARAAVLVEEHPWLVLGVLVACGWLGRLIAGWARSTPTYLPDELVFAELGRSVAESGLPSYLGAGVPFPSVLPAYLTSPAWLFDGVDTGFRVSTGIGALAMSLAAVPVYALARRVRLGPAASLLVAAYVLLLPGLLLGSWLLAEPFLLPLGLAAVWALVVAVEQPGWRPQAAFLLLAALALATKPLAVVLPLAYVAAVLACGVRDRRLPAATREHRLALGALLAAAALAVALGRDRLGVYAGALALVDDPFAIVHWIGRNALALAYACAWAPLVVLLAVVPVSFRRGTDVPRSELALTVATLVVGAGLLVQAGVVSAGVDAHVHERYVLFAVPLVALAAAAGVRRVGRRALAVCGAALAAAVLAVPVSGLAGGAGAADSPTLRAVLLGEERLGVATTAALTTIAALALVAAAAMCWHRSARRVTLAATLTAALTGSVAASVFDAGNSGRVSARLGGNPGWIDASAVGPSRILVPAEPDPTWVLLALFWNRSVDGLAYLDTARELPWLPGLRLGPDESGTLTGLAPGASLVVEETRASVELGGARLVARTDEASVWAPGDRPRLELLAEGRDGRGRLGPRLTLTVWPRPPARSVAGWVELHVAARAGGADAAIAAPAASWSVAAGSTAAVRVPVCGEGPQSVVLDVRVAPDASGTAHVTSTRPVLQADPGACGRDGRATSDARAAAGPAN